MQSEEQHIDEMAARRQFSRFTILVWGMPTAIGVAIANYWERAGGSLEGFLSLRFLVSLLVSLLLVGLVGGWVGGRLMWLAFKRWGGAAR
jgi:hypothetical protein